MLQFSPDGGKLVAGTLGGEVAAYYCIARHDTKYELKYVLYVAWVGSARMGRDIHINFTWIGTYETRKLTNQFEEKVSYRTHVCSVVSSSWSPQH